MYKGFSDNIANELQIPDHLSQFHEFFIIFLSILHDCTVSLTETVHMASRSTPQQTVLAGGLISQPSTTVKQVKEPMQVLKTESVPVPTIKTPQDVSNAPAQTSKEHQPFISPIGQKAPTAARQTQTGRSSRLEYTRVNEASVLISTSKIDLTLSAGTKVHFDTKL